jgi:hypothetical protein
MTTSVVSFHARPSVLAFVFVLAAAGIAGVTACEASLLPSDAAVRPPTAAALADGSYTCTAAHANLLDGQIRRISAAPSVVEARRLAVGPVVVARRAVAVARLIAPGSDSLGEAHDRLEAFERQAEQSASPAEVAARFAELIDSDAASVDEPIQLAALLPDLEVENAKIHGPGNCDYSTGDIIAIVIGFILFIIPGIILLFVLC